MASQYIDLDNVATIVRCCDCAHARPTPDDWIGSWAEDCIDCAAINGPMPKRGFCCFGTKKKGDFSIDEYRNFSR